MSDLINSLFGVFRQHEKQRVCLILKTALQMIKTHQIQLLVHWISSHTPMHGNEWHDKEVRSALPRPPVLPTADLPLNLESSYVRPHTAPYRHRLIYLRRKSILANQRQIMIGNNRLRRLIPIALRSLLDDSSTLYDRWRRTRYFCRTRWIG